MTRATIAALASLTSGQRRVLDRVLLGETSDEIAQSLDLAPTTVINHMRRVRAAFGGDSPHKITARFVVPPPRA